MIYIKVLSKNYKTKLLHVCTHVRMEMQFISIRKLKMLRYHLLDLLGIIGLHNLLAV